MIVDFYWFVYTVHLSFTLFFEVISSFIQSFNWFELDPSSMNLNSSLNLFAFHKITLTFVFKDFSTPFSFEVLLNELSSDFQWLPF